MNDKSLLELTSKECLSIVLPTYNESENILPLISKLLALEELYNLEILVVDDDSIDGTDLLVRDLAKNDRRIRLIRRVGRSGLASAIKEGLLDATGDLAAVMDSDGQHEVSALVNALKELSLKELDLVAGSRFAGDSQILGLSQLRKGGSSLANQSARFSLPRSYSKLTDYMSGCLVLDLKKCLPFIRKVDVSGFKFFYELLAISDGHLLVGEVPIRFQARTYGRSKFDIAIFWDFLISLLHTFSFRLIPRRAISFGLVGASGVFVQLIATQAFMWGLEMSFEAVLPFSVVIAATSNYLINNALTFRFHRLKGWLLLKGLIKFLIVASLPVLANVGLATTFYSLVTPNTFWAQMSGILVVFVWNYAASSRIVWNTP